MFFNSKVKTWSPIVSPHVLKDIRLPLCKDSVMCSPSYTVNHCKRENVCNVPSHQPSNKTACCKVLLYYSLFMGMPKLYWKKIAVSKPTKHSEVLRHIHSQCFIPWAQWTIAVYPMGCIIPHIPLLLCIIAFMFSTFFSLFCILRSVLNYFLLLMYMQVQLCFPWTAF